MAKHIVQNIIDDYLNWYRTRNERYRWAWEAADKRRSPNDLEFVFKLIQACQHDS